MAVLSTLWSNLSWYKYRSGMLKLLLWLLHPQQQRSLEPSRPSVKALTLAVKRTSLPHACRRCKRVHSQPLTPCEGGVGSL